MNIVDAIGKLDDLTNLQVIDESIHVLLKARRKEILVAKKKGGLQVGFVYTTGRGSSKASVRCNCTIQEFSGEFCTVNVVAPMRFATMVVKIDQALLVEPFQIVEQVSSEISHGDTPFQEDRGGQGSDDPLGGIG